MAAIKVKATEICFFESELKEPGSVFWLTDIKDDDGKVIVPAEKQFSAKFMERVDAAPKAKKDETPEQAQAKADENARLNREAKEKTKGAKSDVASTPNDSSPL